MAILKLVGAIAGPHAAFRTKGVQDLPNHGKKVKVRGFFCPQRVIRRKFYMRVAMASKLAEVVDIRLADRSVYADTGKMIDDHWRFRVASAHGVERR